MALNVVNKDEIVREPSRILRYFSDTIDIPLQHWYFRTRLCERENLDKIVPDQNIEVM